MEDYPQNLRELESRFGTEDACRRYLEWLRWPKGAECLRCGARWSWRTGRGLWMCRACGHQSSVAAGTIFQDSRMGLVSWFRAVWWVCAQKNGVSAASLQRILGFRSYQTAWAWLHKLRRAMVRPDRDRLAGKVEVDDCYLGGPKKGRMGRGAKGKTLIAVAAEADGRRLGRIRLARIPDVSWSSLRGFIQANVEPRSHIVTDDFAWYSPLRRLGYRHTRIPRVRVGKERALPRVHLAVSLLQRWLLGTHHGRYEPDQLDYYLDEFVFRFNRRTSRSRGKLFLRLLQNAVRVAPAPYQSLVASGDHNR